MKNDQMINSAFGWFCFSGFVSILAHSVDSIDLTLFSNCHKALTLKVLVTYFTISFIQYYLSFFAFASIKVPFSRFLSCICTQASFEDKNC